MTFTDPSGFQGTDDTYDSLEEWKRRYQGRGNDSWAEGPEFGLSFGKYDRPKRHHVPVNRMLEADARSIVSETSIGQTLTESFVPGVAYYNLAYAAESQRNYLSAFGWHTAGHLDVIGTFATAGVGGMFVGATRGAIGVTGRVGEAALKQLGGVSQKFFRTSQGGRYIDQLVNGIAHESKVGYRALTSDIRLQIAKEVEMMRSGQIQGSVGNFNGSMSISNSTFYANVAYGPAGDIAGPCA